jgi:iron complex outermembrane receptor protein
MGCGRRMPLNRLFVAFSLALLFCTEAKAQTAPAPPPAQPPGAVPPAPGLPGPAGPGELDAPTAAPSNEAPPPEAAPEELPPPTAAEAAGTIELPTEEVPSEEMEISAAPAEEVSAGAIESENGEMIVTGSRIKRSSELARSAPVQIIDRKQLERTGATNAADVVSQLTAAQGSGYQGAGSPLNQGSGAVGTVLVNLRGLGSGATLVLLNGRRLVPTGGGGGTETFSDLSVIPLAAIERVEVLKGGGSAIYGADAVAGVVNVITRSSFDGVRVEVDGQTTTRMDQRDLTLSGSWGAKSEHGRLMIATSYFRRSPMNSDKRENGRVANVDQSGNPATFIIPGFDPATPMRTRFIDPACSMVPGSEVRHPIANGMELPDEICTFNYSTFQSVLPKLERANLFASAAYDISNHTTFFSEFLFNRTRSDNLTTPAYSIPPPFLVVPANHIDNPFGRDASVLGRPLGAAYGAQHNPYGDDTYRVVVGLRGDFADVAKESFAESWEWELTASWGTSRYVSLVPDTLKANLQAAVNSCSDPSNLSNCFNPFYSSVDGTGTPNSKAVIDRFFGMLEGITDHSLATYNGTLSGSLFPLPGGDAGFAVGGEIRHESRMSQLDNDANQQRYSFIVGNTDAFAKRDIFSGFLELRWPLYHGVELQTAGRIEHYTDIGETTPSPFAGLTLVPAEIFGRENTAPVFQRLQLIGQATWAFRAPSLYQAYPGFAILPISLQIPGAPVPVFTPVQAFGNPDLKPETALIFSGGLKWQLIDELSVLLEYWDYKYKNRIAIESSQQALANDVNLMATGGSDPRIVRDPMTRAIQRVQVTQRNIDGSVRTNGIDFGTTFTLTGATLGGGVNDFGALSVGVEGTLTLSYTFPIAIAARRTIPNTSPAMTLPALHCGAKECEAVGSRNYQTFAPPLPRWKFNIPIGWTMNGHSVTVMGHYLSSIEDDNAIGPDGSVGRLPAQMIFDAQYGYTIKDWIGKELAMRIGVYNVFDTLPHQTRDLNGFESLLYDPRGAMAYAKVSATF